MENLEQKGWNNLKNRRILVNEFHFLSDFIQAEVIMKSPVKNLDSFFPAFPEEVPAGTQNLEKKIPDFFDSDLHDDDSVMLAEIYGGEFQKVWKRTHKKWWV